MPWISVLVGLLCGLATWVFIDPILNHRLEKIFRDNLNEQMEIRSTETRHRFESFVDEWSMLGHSFAEHWRLVEYLNSEVLDKTLEEPHRYNGRHPPVWLEPDFTRLNSIDPDQIMLLDGDGIPREIYEARKIPFEAKRVTGLFTGRDEVTITMVNHIPYLLVWSQMHQPLGSERVFLLLVVEIDEHFLLESQKPFAMWIR